MIDSRPIAAALCCLGLAAGCARTVPTGGPRTDVGADLGEREDAGARDVDGRWLDARTDQQADALQLRRLKCAAPTPVGSEVAQGLYGPAIRANGLGISARHTPRREARRPGLEASFGAWTTSTLLPAEARDPTFFLFEGSERVIIAVEVQLDPYARQLQYCATLPATSCTPITVVDDGLGAPIVDDMDGPSVAVVGEDPVMVFNVSTANQPNSSNVFQATPTVAGDLSHWTAEPILVMSRPNLGEDDPTVSADGTIVIYERQTGGQTDLWVAYRHSPSGPLSTPEPLEGINTADPEGSPEIFQRSQSEVELFFNSKRDGDSYWRVYSSRCTR